VIARNSKRRRDLRILEVELAAARKLGRKLQRLLWKDMARFDATGFEFVIAYLLFLRAERTFASIRILSRKRVVDDAFALVRVMVEKVINAEYILLAGTDTALDYIQYYAFREWRDFEELRTVSPEVAPNYSAEVLEQLRNAHDRARTRTLPNGSTKNRFGRGHDWIEIGLSKRAESVDEAIRKRFSMRAFKATRILYHSTYKKGAVYLHGMWASLARSLEYDQSDSAIEEGGKIDVSIGIRVKDKDPQVAIDALNTANLAALAMILFVGKVFGKDEYLKWVDSFRGPYIRDLRIARSAS
jgi:hypothetical protein